MKKILLFLLITMPFFAFGQEKGISEKKDSTDATTSPLRGSVISISCLKDSINNFWITSGNKTKKGKEKALVLINDRYLKEGVSLYDIDIDDIIEFFVIKDEDKLAKYGKRGKYGAVNIKVKDIDKYIDLLEEEYETIVFAPGFESFVTTQPSKSYFTESWLKSKNTLMVTEWNYRHSNPGRYNPRIYEEAVNYHRDTEYGLDVEYTLYMFFRFMEKENNMSLIGDRQITER